MYTLYTWPHMKPKILYTDSPKFFDRKWYQKRVDRVKYLPQKYFEIIAWI